MPVLKSARLEELAENRPLVFMYLLVLPALMGLYLLLDWLAGGLPPLN